MATDQSPHMQDVIQEGKFVIIIMPSGNKKIVQVKADSLIDLGKFGKFSANLIIGKPFGPTYEIINHNEIKRIELKSELEEVEETEANNQAIYDIMTNQKLTHDEIEELKEKSLKGEVRGDDIIKRIIDNHDQFSKKTEYSKAKYKKRKEQRFLRTFTPVQVNMRSICEYFFEKSILKIRELRIDTLSIMLSQANIRAGSKVLVVDDVQGLLVAAVMERLGGHGTVVAIHESEQHNYDIVRYMNFSDNVLDTLHTLSFARAFPIETGNEDEQKVWVDKPAEVMEKMNQEQRNFYEKKKASYERSLKVRDLLLAGEFDGLVIGSILDVLDLVKLLVPLIGGSRPVVAFSPSSETLLPAYHFFRTSPNFLHSNLLTSWFREYQVDPGRLHPLMNTSGSGGYLLVGLRVHGEEAIEGTVTKEDLKSVAGGWTSRNGRGRGGRSRGKKDKPDKETKEEISVEGTDTAMKVEALMDQGEEPKEEEAKESDSAASPDRKKARLE